MVQDLEFIGRPTLWMLVDLPICVLMQGII